MPRRKQNLGDSASIASKDASNSSDAGGDPIKRAPPLSAVDRLQLAQLVNVRKMIILKDDGKAATNKRKNEAWKEITDLMNGRTRDYKRTVVQIKKAWESISTQGRKEISQYDKAIREGNSTNAPELSSLALEVRDIYGEESVAIRGIGGFQSAVDPSQALSNVRASYGSFEGDSNGGSPSSFSCVGNEHAYQHRNQSNASNMIFNPDILTRPGLHSVPSSSGVSMPIIVRDAVDTDAFSDITDMRSASRTASAVDGREVTPVNNGTIIPSGEQPQCGSGPAVRKRQRRQSLIAFEKKDELMCEVLEMEKKKLKAETQYFELAAQEKKLQIARLEREEGIQPGQSRSRWDSDVSY